MASASAVDPVRTALVEQARHLAQGTPQEVGAWGRGAGGGTLVRGTVILQPPTETRDRDTLVVMRPVATGLCGSDNGYVNQRDDDPSIAPFRVAPPGFAPGHETIARVLAVGPGVTRVKVDDLVAVNPHKRRLLDGQKPGVRDHLGFGVAGAPNENGEAYLATPPYPGAFTDIFAHDESRVQPLGQGVDAVTGALHEPLACAMHTVVKVIKGSGKVKQVDGQRVHPLSDQTVVVNGDGSQGLMAAILLRNINKVLETYAAQPRASEVPLLFRVPVKGLRIIIIGVVQERLDAIAAMFRDAATDDPSAPHVETRLAARNPAASAAAEAKMIAAQQETRLVTEFKNPLKPESGVAAVIECSGAPGAMARAARLCRKSAQVVCVGRSALDPAAFQRGEIDLRYTYRFKHKRWLAALELVRRNLLPELPGFVRHLTAIYPIDAADQAFKAGFGPGKLPRTVKVIVVNRDELTRDSAPPVGQPTLGPPRCFNPMPQQPNADNEASR